MNLRRVFLAQYLAQHIIVLYIEAAWSFLTSYTPQKWERYRRPGGARDRPNGFSSSPLDVGPNLEALRKKARTAEAEAKPPGVSRHHSGEAPR